MLNVNFLLDTLVRNSSSFLFGCRKYVDLGKDCPHSGREWYEKRTGLTTEPWGKHLGAKFVRGRGARKGLGGDTPDGSY